MWSCLFHKIVFKHDALSRHHKKFMLSEHLIKIWKLTDVEANFVLIYARPFFDVETTALWNEMIPFYFKWTKATSSNLNLNAFADLVGVGGVHDPPPSGKLQTKKGPGRSTCPRQTKLSLRPQPLVKISGSAL